MSRDVVDALAAAAAQTAAYQQEAVLEACGGRFWRTPDALAKITGLKAKTIARAVSALLAARRLERHIDGTRYRAAPTARPAGGPTR